MKFTAEGRKICKAPAQVDRENGKTTFSLGFPICEVYEYITNAEEIAKAIAKAMCKSDLF